MARIVGLAWIVLVGQAAAQPGACTIATASQDGCTTRSLRGPAPGGGYGPRTAGATWSYTITYAAVPESVALGDEPARAFAGCWFTDNWVEQFVVPGSGVPVQSTPLTVSGASARVAAARWTDLMVHSDGAIAGPGGATSPLALVVRASSSVGPLWLVQFGPNESGLTLGPRGLVVSRDGARVGVALNGTTPDGTGPMYQAVVLDGATGAEVMRWTAAALITSLDLTDNGSVCVVTAGTVASVIDTATGNRIASLTVNGNGGRGVISGDGAVVVTAGFDVRLWTRAGGVYTRRATLARPGLWFGPGTVVSRDGSTVGTIAQDYASGYLKTWTFALDGANGALLGTDSTVGSGSLQDGVAGAAIADDGGVFATATWGTLFNDHPEVRVFDRACRPLGSLDTTGSPMAIDLSPDGRYALVGAKSTHANIFGAGGEVLLYRVPGVCPCAADFDRSGGTPDLTDITAYFADWLGGDDRADTDCSGGTPDATDIADFFTAWLAGGC